MKKRHFRASILCLFLTFMLISCGSEEPENTENESVEASSSELSDIESNASGDESAFSEPEEGPDELTLFKESFEHREISKALDQYYLLTPASMTSANTYLRQSLAEMKTQYYAGAYDYTTVALLLEGFRAFSVIESDVNAVEAEIDDDNKCYIRLEEAKSSYSSGNLENAIEQLKDISATSRYSKEASELLPKVVAAFRQMIIQECDSDMQKKNYWGVSACFEYAFQYLSDDPELTLKRAQYFNAMLNAILNESAVYAGKKDYYNAYNAIHKWDNLMYSERLEEKRLEYYLLASDQAQEEILAEAKKYADKKDWIKAIQYLQSNLDNWHEIDKIEKQIAYYKTKLPVKLEDLNIIETSQYGFSIKEDYTDQFGNIYESCYRAYYGMSEYYARGTFYTNGQYDTFKATIVCQSEYKSDRYVKIYCDDILVKTIYGMKLTDEPLCITLDIAKCKQLTIEFYCLNVCDPVVYNK